VGIGAAVAIVICGIIIFVIMGHKAEHSSGLDEELATETRTESALSTAYDMVDIGLVPFENPNTVTVVIDDTKAYEAPSDE
jgi:hypothetical protein